MSDFLAKPLRKQMLVDAVLRALDFAEQAPTLVPEMPDMTAEQARCRRRSPAGELVG